MKQLISQINQILSETQDKTSVLIHILNQDTPVFEKDSDLQMVSASTIKVPIMCCALEEVHQGNMKLDQMIQVEKED
ncbi:MAG: serine hydrolase, partial [Erysipelotrichaceae bacterium]|nr:serine hydrolase [Erysipelotrichaceae bacterium]